MDSCTSLPLLLEFKDSCNHYTKVMVVCPSVTGGQQKRFDLRKQEVVPLAVESLKLELGDLRECQPWH